MSEQGTFKEPERVGEKEKPLNQVVKGIDKNKVKKVNNEKAVVNPKAAEPKPQPVDWKQAYYDLCEWVESLGLNVQLTCKNNKTKLNAQEKGLKVQEVPIG